MKRAAGFCAIALALGCGDLVFPERSPSIVGSIVEIGRDVPFGDAKTIWVKQDASDQCGIVFLADQAFIGDRPDARLIRRRAFDHLDVGQRVRVWAGAIAESCPAQGSADAIEILSE